MHLGQPYPRRGVLDAWLHGGPILPPAVRAGKEAGGPGGGTQAALWAMNRTMALASGRAGTVSMRS